MCKYDSKNIYTKNDIASPRTSAFSSAKVK